MNDVVAKTSTHVDLEHMDLKEFPVQLLLPLAKGSTDKIFSHERAKQRIEQRVLPSDDPTMKDEGNTPGVFLPGATAPVFASSTPLVPVSDLTLAHNALTTLPHQICQFEHLYRLSLQGNRLTEIPASIGRLHRLQILLLNRNTLVRLPEEISELTSLQVLDVSQNSLRSLSRKLGYLSQLLCFSFHTNPLPMELLCLEGRGVVAALSFLQ